MLVELSIRSLVLVDQLEIELSRGLTAITGETGAGKSVLLDAVGLLAGATADKSLVKTGSNCAHIRGAFSLPSDHPVWSILEDHGVSVDPMEMLVLERQVFLEGPSRARINRQIVTVKTLREIGGQLVEIFAHNSASNLLDTDSHLSLLDDFANAQDILAELQALYQTYSAARQSRQSLEAAQAQLEARREWLDFVIADLDQLAASPGEEKALSDQRSILVKSEKLHTLTADAETALIGSNINSALSDALNALDELRSLVPADLTSLVQECQSAFEAVERAGIEVGEAQQSVQRLAHNFDREPDALPRIEARLFELRSAARKHKCEPDQLGIFLETCRSELDELEDQAAKLNAARETESAAQSAYGTLARRLSDIRRDAAAELERAVGQELAPLHLEKVGFAVDFQIEDRLEPSPYGIDRIEFLADTRTGSGFSPLRKIASSGELARFALALKCALSRAQSTCTLFFDEADQGVGGAVAASIGQRLQRLAAERQVLAITHAPQVASAAKQQWQVQKAATGDRMLSRLSVLDDTDRLEEIARMLSGASVTDEARAAASKLLEVA